MSCDQKAPRRRKSHRRAIIAAADPTFHRGGVEIAERLSEGALRAARDRDGRAAGGRSTDDLGENCFLRCDAENGQVELWIQTNGQLSIQRDRRSQAPFRIERRRLGDSLAEREIVSRTIE